MYSIPYAFAVAAKVSGSGAPEIVNRVESATSIAERRIQGTASSSSSVSLCTASMPVNIAVPVKLRPGRAYESINPHSIGKKAWLKTMGTVRVASAAAAVAKEPAAINSSAPNRRSSASASAGMLSMR